MPDEKSTDEETLDEKLDESLDDKTDDEKSTEESEDDKVVALEKALDAQKSVNETQIADLRRSIGRVQSIVEKSTKDGTDSSTALREAIQGEFGDVRDLLDAIVNSADETVFDPSLKAKIAEARALAAHKADVDSLRNDLDEKFEALKAASQPTSETDRTVAQTLEASVVNEITDHGLDHNDFNWDEAATQFKSGGEPAVRKYFRAQIAEKLIERDTDTRRQARKTDAGDGDPNPKGANRSPEERLGADDVSLAEKIDILKDMGAI